MSGRTMRASKPHRKVSWGLLWFLATSFLNMCALSPLVHAELLRQTAGTRDRSAGHCSAPSAVPQTAGASRADHDRASVPVCCVLEGSRKAISEAVVRPDTSPRVVQALLPPDVSALTSVARHRQLFQTLHSANPPPLHVLHVVLLL
jgi:hypothetical protein